MLAARASNPRPGSTTVLQTMHHVACRVQQELLLRCYGALRALACLLATVAARTWIANNERAAVAASEDVDRIDADPKRKESTLLPPPAPEHRGKLTVCLDLDQTLVCAYTADGVPSTLKELQREGKVKSFRMRYDAGLKVRNGAPGSKAHTIVVFERPGLQEFLERVSKFAELVLFTSAREGYARPLMNALDPRGKIGLRLYRETTVNSNGRADAKDLSRLGRDLGRTILVDDNPHCFSLQPTNGVPIMPYDGTKDDAQLLTVLLPLIESLSPLPDVRPVLNLRFNLPQWFLRASPAKASRTQ